jgi:hypothetical protein
VAVVEFLLQVPGVDAAAENNFAIRYASLHGHVAVVERLLQVPGVDAAAENNFAIRYASLHGHVAMVEPLLQVPEIFRLRNGPQVPYPFGHRWATSPLP